MLTRFVGSVQFHIVEDGGFYAIESQGQVLMTGLELDQAIGLLYDL